MDVPTKPGRARVRSLTDDLRSRSDAALAALLRARPDLARPVPADVAALGARAATRPSVRRALEGLDRGRLHVLEALVVSGEQTVDRDRAAALLGLSPARLRPVIDELFSLALVWGGAGDLHVVRAAVEALGPYVAGLAPLDPGADADLDVDHVLILEQLEQGRAADANATAVLEKLTWGPPVGTFDAAGTLGSTVRSLVAAGLLRRTADGVLLPRHVALALRGGRLHRDAELTAPEVDTRTVGADAVAATAAGAASLLLERLDELAADWGAAPPRVLRSGGLAALDLRRLATRLDLPVEQTALLVEIAWAAGLVGDDGALEPVWAPTPAYDESLERPASQRWADVARAWLDLTRAPHLVGTRRDRPRQATPTLVNALSDDASWPGVRTVRRQVLDEVAELPEGLAYPADSVVACLAWRMPLRLSTHVREAVPALLAEAEFVGVLGRGALAPAGRALLDGAEGGRVAAELDADLPAEVREVMLQADLTAVVPGRVEGRLGAFLRLVADLESRGGASVYRFTEAGVRRGLDAGWSADDLLTMLREHSRTPVPQPLDYLVHDVARRHGRARVGAVSSYVRSDDPQALDAIEARGEFAPLRLRRLAPTVLVSPAAPATLLEMLRAHGFAPVAESADGGLVTTRRDDHRAPTRRRQAAPALRTTLDETEAVALVAAVRSGDAAAAASAASASASDAVPSSDPAVTLALVREAIADRTGVWIGVTDDHGTARRVLLRPDRVEAGRVHGVVEEAGARRSSTPAPSDSPRSFSLHRITGAAPAE